MEIKLPARRLIALLQMIVFTVVWTADGKAFASHSGGSSSGAGAAAGPAGKILESFHSDLATGRAIFSIPLAVPPGRRGIQPAIGLSYSSAARNGPAGVGWALEFGAIERSTRFGIPKFDSSDTFTLQAGATGDLIQVAPGEYRMKDEQTFSRILFNGTSWTVTAKDGTTVTFGGTPDSVKTTSRGVVSWLANQVQDIHGNTMTFTYSASGRQIYPDVIRYTSHPSRGIAPSHEVRFIWEPRPDKEWDCRFGDRIETDRRLKTVEAFTGNALVRRYSFSYTQSPINGRSTLTQVTTFGSDGTTSLPPITLIYSNAFSGWTRSTGWKDLEGNTPLSFAETDGKDNGTRLEDVTGDGRPDCLRGKEATIAAWRNTAAGWVRDDRFKPPLPFVIPNPNGFNEDMGGRFADLNGDGRVDIIYSHQTRHGAVYLNTGSGWREENSLWSLLGKSGGPALYFVDGAGRDMGLRLVDLNGDGKTDLLQGMTDSLHAYLNTGSGWIMDDRWAPPVRFINDVMADYGARLADMNGDGLTDLFYAGLEEKAVYLNTGGGWAREMAWNSGLFQGGYFTDSSGDDQGWRLFDVNGDGLPDLLRHAQSYSSQVLLNTGAGWTADSARFLPEKFLAGPANKDNGVRVADLNADGMADLVYANPGQTEYAELWPATPPDLLTQVANGTGGTTTLTYTPSTSADNSGGDGFEDLPFVTQTVASQTISNGLGWSATTSFIYTGGKFDAAKREFLGFAYARVTDPIGTTSETWFHQDIHLKGRPFKQEAKDSAGKLYSRTENSWACNCGAAAGMPPGVHFCHLASTTSTVFDGDDTSRQTKVSYTYDLVGNVTLTRYEGDTAVDGDEKNVAVRYALSPSNGWLMAFPKNILTTDAAGALISERWFNYDNNAGNDDPPRRGLITQEKQRLSGAEDPITISSTYDPYGNRLTATDPLGRTTTTTYDDQATFPVQVANALGHTLKTTYDPGTGNVLSTTDPNGQTTTNRYDPLGRLIAVIGPLDTEAAPSVRYEYDLSTVPTRATKRMKVTSAPAYEAAYSFSDGLGRVVQTRAPARDPAQQIVSGRTVLGPRGEVSAQYMPAFSPISANYDSSPPAADAPRVRYEYDAVGRHIRTIDPDGAVSRVAYNDWTVTATDPNGSSTVRESDAYGRLVRVTEPATADHPPGTTAYAYDPAGRLAQVTDAKGSVTQIQYDLLGRKVSMSDPDMGAWSYQYDAAGNLTQQTDAKGQVLEFAYDSLNRLTLKTGRPSAAGPATSLASYTYDQAGKPNCIGRLSKVTDPSGSTEFWYDLLGREVKNTKIIAGSSFTVQREFDPLNRLTRLIYPDGTDLRYEYSPQGIARIYSVHPDGSTADYLTHAEFNAAGETLQLKLGNGVTTDYAYDPLTLRIAGIQTRDPIGRTLQDFSYTFDPNGNLVTLSDRVHSASQSFQYDALNRLTLAGGTYGTHGLRFDTTGNLLQKDNNITLTYGETGGAKPHAATRCSTATGDHTLAYDPNGNLVSKTPVGVSPSNPTTYSYDLQNRLIQVVTPAPAPPPVPPDPNAPFLEQAGLLSIEAEHAQESITRNSQSWQSLSSQSNASGGLCLQAAPNTGKSYNKASDYTTKSPELKFQVSIQTPGTYYIWLRSRAPSSKDASIHAGLDNTPTPSADRICLQSGAGFIWTKNTLDSVRATVSIPSAGTHTLNLWMREDGFIFDKLLLTKDPNFTPTGTGPAESPRVKVTPPPPVTTTFTYDGDGGRVKVTSPEGSTTFVGSLYERLPTGTTRAHLFLGPTRLATLERTAVLTASARQSDSPFALSLSKGERRFRRALAAIEKFFVGTAYADTVLPAGMKLQFYHGDHLGSVNLLTDHTGARVQLKEYAPYGSSVRAEQSSTVPQFGFTGKRLDSSTGLYYYGARYYDPELGRFIQPDTIVQAPSDPQTLNRYTYCRNNPLIYTDPTGHSFWKKVGRALGAIGRVVVSAVAAAVTFVATGGNIPAAAAAFSFTNTFLSASAQGASFGRALGASAVMATAAYFGANYAIGAGPLSGAFIGASFGAAGSSASSAILGGSPGRAALSGAVGGAIMGGLGGAFGLPGALASSAAAGSASAAVGGGNVGEGAYLGAIGSITFAVASASLQTLVDAGRAKGVEGGTHANRAQQPVESGYAQMIAETLDPIGAVRLPQPSPLTVNQGIGTLGRILASAGLTGVGRAVGGINAGLSPGGDWAAVFGSGAGSLGFKLGFNIGNALGGPIVGGVAGIATGGIFSYLGGRAGATLDRPEAGYALGEGGRT